MKTIPLEQMDEKLAKLVEGQGEHGAIRLTKNQGEPLPCF